MINIKTLNFGPMANSTYIVSDSESSNCFIVDPSWDMQSIENTLAKENLKPAFIILTHGHFDHSKNLCELVKKLNVPVYIHKEDVFMLEKIPSENIKTLKGDCELKLNGTKIEIIHTPGHTKGGICILIEKNLFTGDTLFVGQCGRVDFPYSAPEKMHESLVKLSKMDKDIKILPGHMPETSTIGNEIKTNSCLKLALKSREDFLEAMR